MRPWRAWADRLYTPSGYAAHVVPWDDDRALCGRASVWWFGTGSQKESDYADNMPLCRRCGKRLRRQIQEAS